MLIIKKVIIDGNNFSNEEEFYDEMESLLTRGSDWRTGHNLAAFDDLLYGGFGFHDCREELDITWIHAAKSKKDFAYHEKEHLETVHYLDRVPKKHDPNITDEVNAELDDPQLPLGGTFFDVLVDIIQNSKGSNCKLTIID